MDTFSSYVLVKDYDAGLKISKQYHVNCITAEKEVIYAQSYLCKVGKDPNIDDKLELYNKYAERKYQFEQSSNNLENICKIVNDLQTVELQLMKSRAIV